eukprot:TRINITY_DN8143_c0_g1_i1.p1 TRINITY_DN8143_c0_g1~~TRINITY_DN8143_c0_g1_i1.p1  ORF type:complete len:751 (+),score=139.93 TRINITY_DN8143_c0_g1_i1:246-2498(+)
MYRLVSRPPALSRGHLSVQRGYSQAHHAHPWHRHTLAQFQHCWALKAILYMGKMTSEPYQLHPATTFCEGNSLLKEQVKSEPKKRGRKKVGEGATGPKPEGGPRKPRKKVTKSSDKPPPVDLLWPDHLYADMKAKEAYDIYKQMHRLDVTGWASFRIAEIVQNAGNDNYGITGEDTTQLAKQLEAAKAALEVTVENLDDPKYKYALGKLYVEGYGDPKKGLSLLKKASKDGNVFSQNYLGELFVKSKKRDLRKALVFFRLAAAQGSARAQYNIANLFGASDKEGEVVDVQEAFSMALLAYEKKYVHAESAVKSITEKLQDPNLLISVLQHAADRGVTYALNDLARRYAEGDQVPVDPESSMKYKKMLAESGDAPALTQIGLDHLNGNGVEKNVHEALHFLKIAADKGDGKAINTIGEMYHYGIGVEKDTQRALEHYQKASLLDNPEGLFNLGRLYWNGEEDFPAQKEPGFGYLLIAATDGIAAAQNLVSEIYEKGEEDICEKNEAESLKWLRAAHENKHVEATMRLGYLYLNGSDLVERDMEEAKRLYHIASDMGEPKAHLILSLIYRNEDKCSECVHYINLAIKADYVRAHVTIASMYYNGHCVPLDRTKTVEHLTIAAEKLDGSAMAYLAVMYRRGDGGLAVDMEKANKLLDQAMYYDRDAAWEVAESYRISEALDESVPERKDIAAWIHGKAAEEGNVESMYILGQMYEGGEGVVANKEEALRLYQKAANNGYDKAQVLYDALRAKV